jgi:protein-L-isoaspartate(D-aspartate) O-methyltransferase
MTEALAPKPTDKVLEIGTGSGYQAAVLSSLVRDVYTIEIVDHLGRKAARTLKRLKFSNVHVRIGDGFVGWPEHAPFDKIIVTCSPESIPQPLVDQLNEGGRMVIPVGERYQQTLYLFTKKDGELLRESLRPTLFVPMTGEAESRRDVKPDPLKPTIVNGSFEANPESEGQLPGWYYQRQLELISARTAVPAGERYVRFANTTPGRGSRALQGLAIDGRSVTQLEISAWIKTRDVVAGPGHLPGSDDDRLPSIALTFYDAQRRQLGHFLLGTWQGTQDWQRVAATIDVPDSTREAILRLGLFGATGEFFVDDVRLQRASAQ